MRPSYLLLTQHLPLQDHSSSIPLMSRFWFLLSVCSSNIFIGLTILLLLLRLLNERVIIWSTSFDVPGDSHHFSREEDDEPPGSLVPPHCLYPPSSHFYHLFSASPQSTSPSIHVQGDFNTFLHPANHCRARSHSQSHMVLGIDARIRTEYHTLCLETLGLSFAFFCYVSPLPITILDYLSMVLYSILW